jgi:2'-5' RNA ligase
MAGSALIVRVPEAEAHVAGWRSRFDPAASQGVPAHITVLYPFAPPDKLGADVLDGVSAAIATMRAFEFRLATTARFAGCLYLAPEPAEPFVELTTRIAARFPEHPPYGGQFDAIVPHLTVAHAGEADERAVEAGLRASLAASGAIESSCREIVLIENSSGLWRTSRAFALASRPSSRA